MSRRTVSKERKEAERMLAKAERLYLRKHVGKEPGFSWGAFAGAQLVKVKKGPKKGRTVLAIHTVHVFSQADAKALATAGMKFIPHISKAVKGKTFGGSGKP